jgi:predicted nucleotide-binding protein (sugar kinase/HSP70/actin superfamily)
MCKHETKNCQRCNAAFECKPGSITQCQCYPIKLTAGQQVYIQQRYADCLCQKCLEYLSSEYNLFKEKYIFR